jgi:hypothetical protein
MEEEANGEMDLQRGKGKWRRRQMGKMTFREEWDAVCVYVMWAVVWRAWIVSLESRGLCGRGGCAFARRVVGLVRCGSRWDTLK